METYHMIYKKLEAFNNYKITNIILYKMFIFCLQFVYNLFTIFYHILGKYILIFHRLSGILLSERGRERKGQNFQYIPTHSDVH